MSARLDNAVSLLVPGLAGPSEPAPDLERIGEVPIYHADAIVRRAPALQRTHDARAPSASMNSATLARLGLRVGAGVRIGQGAGAVDLPAALDDGLPTGCVRVASGHPATAALGPMFGPISAAVIATEERKVV
jgi:NADH-quinone oxidoreductase subunit G